MNPPGQTEALTKRYGGLTAVRHLDLTVRPGEAYAGKLLAVGVGAGWLVATMWAMLGAVLAVAGLPGPNAGALAAALGAPGGTPGVAATVGGGPAAVVVAAYLVGFAAVGAALLRRRDIG
ncbi:hypothetical protein [Micromonospora sp. NPDC051141]|uniref:hypothetical protein n=1 Tax=Micromonospora sp. NPDC051141 TaxID=3364284 RepID=UPI003798D096